MSDMNTETYKYGKTERIVERAMVLIPNFATDRLEIQLGPRILELDRLHILTLINDLELNLKLLNDAYLMQNPADKSKERVFLTALTKRADENAKQTLERMKGN